ncbi:MAG: hypothetical protein ACREQA_03950 [Candidatus Binatia bacterium]
MRSDILPPFFCVLTIVLFALAVILEAYLLVGLIYNIIGVVFLAWEELINVASLLGIQAKASDAALFFADLEKHWYRRLPLWLAAKYGPREAIMAVGRREVSESFPMKAWGLVFLILGFILQAVSTLSR